MASAVYTQFMIDIQITDNSIGICWPKPLPQNSSLRKRSVVFTRNLKTMIEAAPTIIALVNKRSCGMAKKVLIV